MVPGQRGQPGQIVARHAMEATRLGKDHALILLLATVDLSALGSQLMFLSVVLFVVRVSGSIVLVVETQGEI